MADRPVPDPSLVYAALTELGYTKSTAVIDFQRDWRPPVTGLLDYPTMMVVLDAVDAQRLGAAARVAPPCQAVVGRVAGPAGEAAPGLTARLIEVGFRNETPLGSATTDGDGGYAIAYARSILAHGDALVVRIHDGATAAAESAPRFAPPPLLKLDFTVDATHLHGPTEYARLAAVVSARTGTTAVADLKPADVAFLSGATGQPAEKLAQLVIANRLSALGNQIDPAFFYALLREETLLGVAGTVAGARFAIDLATPAQPLYYDVVLLDPAAVGAAVAAAVDARLVPSSVTGELAAIRATLDQSAAAAADHRRTQQPMQLLATLAANLAAGKHVEVLNALRLPQGGDPRAIADALDAIQFVTADGTPASGTPAGDALGAALASDPNLLDELRSLANLAGTQPPPPEDPTAPAPATAPPATTAFLADLQAAPAQAAPPFRDQIVQLLQANPTFDLQTGDVDQLLAGQPPSPDLRAALKSWKRLFRLAPSYAQSKTLLDGGLHSAAQIASFGRGQFVHRFTADGTFGQADAAAVHQRATDLNTATGLLAAELRGLSNAAAASVMPAEVAAKLKLVSADNPNLQNLFQSISLCDCQACNAIDSPAAYLVDVLQFIAERVVVDTTKPTPTPALDAQKVLFARRSDLGDIDLSCDNTNVPLPIIDIVCELLEQAVSPDPGIAYAGALAPGIAPASLVKALAALGFTDAAFIQSADLAGNLYLRDAAAVCKLVPGAAPDTWTAFQLRQTFQSADQLAAMPEYVNYAAYQVLQNSQIAFHLPYDLFHDEARAYFAQSGVSRSALMNALAVKGAPSAAAAAADALGIASDERALIVTPAPTAAAQEIYWNTGTTDPATSMNNVAAFLARTELQYLDLQSLLACRFINPGGALYLKHLDSSCDTKMQQIVGLDDAALDRIHRFLRLRKALGASLAAVDAAVMGKRLGGAAIDDHALVELAALAGVETRLGLTIDQLVAWYGRLSTDASAGRSQYDTLFANPANGTPSPSLSLASVRANSKLATPLKLGDPSLAAPLATALGVAAADLAALIQALTAPPLDAPALNPPPLANDVLSEWSLAALAAQLALAGALGRSVAELLLVEQLSGVNPLASPSHTARFLAENDRIAASGLAPADLQFLLAYAGPSVATRALGDAAVTAILTTLQTALLAAQQKFHSPFGAHQSADENEAAIGALVGQLPGVSATQLGGLKSVFDDNWTATTGTAQQLLDALLAPFAIDPTAIDAALAALLATPKKDAGKIEKARLALEKQVADDVSSYLYGLARDAAVAAAIAGGLSLDSGLVAAVLPNAHLAPGGSSLLQVLGADALLQPKNVPPTPALKPQYAAVRLVAQIAAALQGAPFSSDDVAWLLQNGDHLPWLQLDALPRAPGDKPVPYARWSRYQDLLGLFARYPAVVDPSNPQGSPLTLRSVLEAALAPGATNAGVLAVLTLVTGWPLDVLTGLDARFAFTVAGYLDPATWLALEAAVVPLRRLGLSLAGGLTTIVDPLTADVTALLRQSLKARYASADWLGVLGQIYGPLRQKKRDALVAWLLANNPGFTSSDDLFDYFLIDVEQSACQPTSRIVSAHGSLQLFVQRCLLGIEPAAVADVTVDDGWNWWQWMQQYRLWQAQRAIFHYPENWIQEPLRDDKSQPYQDLESALQQSNLDQNSITTATNGFLEALDQISFLEVVSLYYQETNYTLHVFARTKGGSPPTYFHRTLVNEQTWTPWQRVDLDIKSDHLIAFIRNERLCLAWPIFTANPNQTPTATVPSSTAGTPVPTKADQQWQIQLAFSQYANGKWTASVTSQDALYWPPAPSTDPLQDQSLFRFVPLDWRAGGFVILCSFLDASLAQGYGDVALGGFTLDGCKGYPTAFQYADLFGLNTIPVVFKPWFEYTMVENERFTELTGGRTPTRLAINTFIRHKWVTILDETPSVFRVTWPQQLSSIDYLLFIWETLHPRVQADAIVQRHHRRWIPLGTFMPYFFEDGYHDYCIIPSLKSVPSRFALGRPSRYTFSNFIKLLQETLLLFEIYYSQYLNLTDRKDVNKLIVAFFKDPVFKDVRRQLGEMLAARYGIEFHNFYHPLICPLREILYGGGLSALMARETQLMTTPFDFNAWYTPKPIVRHPYPTETIEFGSDDVVPVPAYASYNWELFFHLPFEIAGQLSGAQQFQTAMQWFNYIFDPMDPSKGPVPQKYWQTKPFYERTDAQYQRERIDEIMNGLDTAKGGYLQILQQAVLDWRNNPYEPFVVARSRTVAFQQAVLMQYLNNLIAWGDSLFTQGTMETVNQATQLYILADKLLGPEPMIVPPLVTPPSETYRQLRAKSIDVYGNAMLDLEDLIPDLKLLPHQGKELPPPPVKLHSLYFCIPPNPNLLQYWSTVADRLFKIRNCQDINGVERTLALFAPPIDPGALVAAAAAGLSPSQILQSLNAPLPFYRFTAMAQKASELAQQVSTFGTLMLSALEKKDAEALALLRATQEISLQNATIAVKQQQLADAQKQLTVLQNGIAVTTAKSTYYHSRGPLNALEQSSLQLNQQAIAAMGQATDMDNAAAYLHLIPSFSIGVAGIGGTAQFGASFGGENIAGALSAAASVVRSRGSITQAGAGVSGTLGSYLRRQDEWTFNAGQADLELAQLQTQLTQAQIRVQVAQDELNAQQVQLTNAGQVSQFLQSKFSNEQLYQWMIAQLSAVYFAAYQTALDVAHKAERCYQYELGVEGTFIQYNYWDATHRGLLAGDLLLNDLKRLELAYVEQNQREYELTKNVSLAMLDAPALIALQNTGACIFNLPEAIFDLDHPGQYFRRLKTVSLTIPCVAGPYTSVSAKLSIVGNAYRATTNGTDSGAAYPEQPPGGDSRFRYNLGAIQSIATSQGQSDDGLFQLDFKDERYLPFEGQGAISSWRLELPSTPPDGFPQFDYQTITDVIVTVKYTARDAGSTAATTVQKLLGAALQNMLVDAKTQGLYQGFNARLAFPDAWFLLQQPKTAAAQLTVDSTMFPFFTQAGKLSSQSSTWFALAPKATTLGMTIAIGAGAPQPIVFAKGVGPQAAQNLWVGSTPTSAALALGQPFTLAIAGDPTLVEELALVVNYKVT